MTSWFERGRPALFEALTRACEQIDRDLVAELQQKGLEIGNHACLGNLSTSVSPAVSFNADFQLVTEARDHAQASTPTPGIGGGVDSKAHNVEAAPDASDEEERDWKAEYAKLSARYNALSHNFKKARDALQKRKDERDRWIQHATLLEKRAKAAEEEHGIRILDRDQAKSKGKKLEDTGNRSIASIPDPAISRAAPEVNKEPADGSDDGASVGPADSDSTESVTTQDKSQQGLPPMQIGPVVEEPYIKQEPSSEGVEFLEERPLKKRRGVDGDVAPRTPLIKTEAGTNSSSPLVSLHRFDFNPHESPDLGETVAEMVTPRKRKAVRYEPEHSVLEDVGRVAELPRPAVDSHKAAENKTQQGRDRFTSALTPIDPNKLRRPMQTPIARLEKPLSKDIGHGIARLAEDGGGYGSTTPTMPATAKLPSKGRLDLLLNSPSADEQLPISRTAPRLRDRTNILRDDLHIPKPRELPFDRADRQTRPKGVKTPPVIRGPWGNVPPPSSAPEATGSLGISRSSASMLRSRSPSKLKLDDFKINPRVNDGHDFAFSEVVRDRNERACLPGCVDMHCCGKTFRALALSQRPDPPLTAAQRAEETRLLEEYLGDECDRIPRLSSEERAELWLQAKTRELANKFGRHKHRYSRMQSPPGFWNADFPSTQELEAEKSEASKREKQTVQERYREAMRPGGRWVFRDE
ncbi:unnamed protein product [Clonostachys rhizophaga]|uniref:DNA endonuclease activator Ctp1 C-terminal domain-containing protein n=1 Tax=Clonostachys rhizophaga TaxID=160324 RepID=A0A9N9V616_9HYPO|nr:unnamed protein product [Clonostachys rhizophaga]